MLDGTKESPPEVPKKSRRTLMSPKECQVARCSPNQLEITTIPVLWFQSNAPFQIIQDDWLGFLWATPEIPSDTLIKTIGTPTSFGTRGKLHACHIVSRRADSQDSIKEVGHNPTTPHEEPSLSNRYVRGTLNLLCHVQWIPRFPGSKDSQISLQWFECRLVFLLTI